MKLLKFTVSLNAYSTGTIVEFSDIRIRSIAGIRHINRTLMVRIR